MHPCTEVQISVMSQLHVILILIEPSALRSLTPLPMHRTGHFITCAIDDAVLSYNILP